MNVQMYTEQRIQTYTNTNTYTYASFISIILVDRVYWMCLSYPFTTAEMIWASRSRPHIYFLLRWLSHSECLFAVCLILMIERPNFSLYIYIEQNGGDGKSIRIKWQILWWSCRSAIMMIIPLSIIYVTDLCWKLLCDAFQEVHKITMLISISKWAKYPN